MATSADACFPQVPVYEYTLNDFLATAMAASPAGDRIVLVGDTYSQLSPAIAQIEVRKGGKSIQECKALRSGDSIAFISETEFLVGGRTGAHLFGFSLGDKLSSREVARYCTVIAASGTGTYGIVDTAKDASVFAIDSSTRLDDSSKPFAKLAFRHIDCCAVDAKSGLVAVGTGMRSPSSSGRIEIWSASSNSRKFLIEDINSPASTMQFLTQHELLFVGHMDGAARFFSLRDGREVLKLLDGDRICACSLVIPKTDLVIYSTLSSKETPNIFVVDIKKRKVITSHLLQKGAKLLAFNASKSELIICTNDGPNRKSIVTGFGIVDLFPDLKPYFK